eukprot:10753396-Heterocapsa_arctica.AAC.1
MAIRYSSRRFATGYVTQIIDAQWIDHLWTTFLECLKLQIDVRSDQCRNVMNALMRSDAFT